MYIDYRTVNKVTIRNKYPLPRIDECLERLQGAAHFTTLDLVSGCYQICIQPSNVPRTGFSTRYGHYDFVCYRLVLNQCTANFLMNDILRDYIVKSVIVYLDSIIVSNRKVRRKQHVRLVLEKLQKAKFIVNREKCIFNKKRTYLCWL